MAEFATAAGYADGGRRVAEGGYTAPMLGQGTSAPATVRLGRSLALNPIDHMLLATHESMRQRGYCGLNALWLAELEGRIDPGALAAAVERVARAHPILAARIGFSSVRGRALWVLPSESEAQPSIEFESHAAGTLDDPDEPFRRALGESLDPTAGTHLCVIHVDLGAGRHRLGLRWPHHLMDLEGAHALMKEIAAALVGRPGQLSGDPEAVHAPPFRANPAALAWRAMRGSARHVAYCLVNQPRLVRRPEDAPPTADFLVRHFDAAARRRFEEVARTRCAPGPMLYLRGLMIAVARTYLDMARERGRPRRRHLISCVLPWPGAGARPGLRGNYVTLPWIAFTAEDLSSWSTADATATQQLTDYTRKRRDAANWTMLRMAQGWPFRLVRYLATHRHPRAAVGLSSYRFEDQPLRFGDAVVRNVTGTATNNCHPGWILARTTYADTMSITIGYFQNFVDSASMREFLERLENLLLVKRD